MNEIIEALNALKDVYINYPKRIALLNKQLDTAQKEIQDLLHLVELTNFNASEGYKIAKDLQKVRMERRKIKDEIALLEAANELQSYLKPPEKIINKVVSDVNNVLQSQSKRTYKMRVRDDLRELIKQ